MMNDDDDDDDDIVLCGVFTLIFRNCVLTIFSPFFLSFRIASLLRPGQAKQSKANRRKALAIGYDRVKLCAVVKLSNCGRAAVQ